MKKIETTSANRYERLIERIFLDRYQDDAEEVTFKREDIEEAAAVLDIQLPKNLGDLIYSFRYRTSLPASIRSKEKDGKSWIIRPAGRAKYTFVLVAEQTLAPSTLMLETKIPGATPGLIAMYASQHYFCFASS